MLQPCLQAHALQLEFPLHQHFLVFLLQLKIGSREGEEENEKRMWKNQLIPLKIAVPIIVHEDELCRVLYL